MRHTKTDGKLVPEVSSQKLLLAQIAIICICFKSQVNTSSGFAIEMNRMKSNLTTPGVCYSLQDAIITENCCILLPPTALTWIHNMVNIFVRDLTNVLAK